MFADSLVSAGRITAALLGTLDPTALFRLAFVIVPGTAYLLYRCFRVPQIPSERGGSPTT
jgi:hypothetical protein